jgi:8-oxo-dGTP diphosphatase
VTSSSGSHPVGSDPTPTAVTHVYLIRHAKAGSRHKWVGPDHLRPLTKAGRRQAEALSGLVELPISRIVSSPYVRCIQTVEPLAEARGLELETTHQLSEGASVEGALDLMRALAGDGTAALCTHGDVMVGAIDELASAGIPLEGPLEFKKGATWILEIRDGAFRSGRYLPPPTQG